MHLRAGTILLLKCGEDPFNGQCLRLGYLAMKRAHNTYVAKILPYGGVDVEDGFT